MLRFATPEDVGLKGFKNVPLSIDKCVSPAGLHKGEVAATPYGLVPKIAAHTHTCQSDPHFRYICIPSWAIKDISGEPSVIFWHEYGHFLNPEVSKYCSEHTKFFPSGTPLEEIEIWKQERVRKEHGDKFKEIMTKLGRPELAVPQINISNITFMGM